MRVKLDEVPLEARRRAARHLEAVRATPMARAAGAARLGDEACPVYRPDVKGVAYWEFEIVGVRAARRTPANGRRAMTDRGFLLVSTGKHDVPVPHWSVELEPPSRSLEALAKEPGTVARVVKLDTLAYAAENRKGAYVAHIGQFPPLPGVLPKPFPKEPTVSSLRSYATAASKSDRKPAKQAAKGNALRAPRPKLGRWKSWEQAKKQYGAAYRPHLAALRARADQAWQVEALVAKFGEGIHEGDKVVVPLLKPGKADVSGPGVGSVRMRMLDRNPPAVELVAGGAKEQKEQDFQLRLSYADGSVETLSFFVVPKGTPSNQRRVLPHPAPLPSPR